MKKVKKHIIVVGLLAVSCVCEAGLFDAVKNVASGVAGALDNQHSFEVCDDGGLGGCRGSLEEYKDGKYCRAHLAIRKQRDENRARVEAERKRNEADHAARIARVKAQYEREKEKWAAAEKRWLAQAKELPCWGKLSCDHGKEVEGLFACVSSRRDDWKGRHDQLEYRVYTGFATPPEPDELSRGRRHRAAPRSESIFERFEFEGNKYLREFKTLSTTNEPCVVGPENWAAIRQACDSGKTAEQISNLQGVITNFYGLKWDLEAAELLEKHYRTVGETNEIQRLIATVPWYHEVRKNWLAREEAEKYRSGDMQYRYPCDALCKDHPNLYKELSAGASRQWCFQWLKENAKDFRAYDERYDEDWFAPSRNLKKNEVKATVGKHELILRFDPFHDVLVAVTCSFGQNGISRDAVIEKYRAQFGDDAKVEVKSLGARKDGSLSSVPRTRKDQRELDRMRYSDNGLANVIARETERLDPFGGATLNSNAEICYLNEETIVISGKGTEVRASCKTFKGIAFLLNSTYNRLANEGRLVDLENQEKVPADAFYDETGACKVLNDSCRDALESGKGMVTWLMEQAKKLDNKIFSIEITGTSLKASLAEEEKKRNALQEEKANDEKRKAEADALNF